MNQVPGSTTYSLALYYMMNTPVEDAPLLESFIKGDDAFRNSRFKLIPYISKVSKCAINCSLITHLYIDAFPSYYAYEIESHQVIQLITFSSTFLVFTSYQFLELILIL